MKSLLEYLITSLTTHKDQVKIAESSNGNELTFRVSVAPEDAAKIIGKNGRTIKAIRTILRTAAAATANKARVYVVITNQNQQELTT